MLRVQDLVPSQKWTFQYQHCQLMNRPRFGVTCDGTCDRYCTVQGSGRVQSRVQGVGCRVQPSGTRGEGSGFRVQTRSKIFEGFQFEEFLSCGGPAAPINEHVDLK